MAQGSVRNIPSNLGGICPDPGAGTCFDLLSADHIADAFDSALLIPFAATVPEPSGLALLAIGLVAAGTARRRNA
jgi:hypothetical protein